MPKQERVKPQEILPPPPGAAERADELARVQRCEAKIRKALAEEKCGLAAPVSLKAGPDNWFKAEAVVKIVPLKAESNGKAHGG